MADQEKATVHDHVKEACKKCYPHNKHACNHFVQAVAAELKIGDFPSGTADDIAYYLFDHWPRLASPSEAVSSAKAGFLVIAALPSGFHARAPVKNAKGKVIGSKIVEHGHVGIVVEGALYHGRYPRVWCGSIGGSGMSDGKLSVGEVWSKRRKQTWKGDEFGRDDRDEIWYFRSQNEVPK